jgi:hypothetical protein
MSLILPHALSFQHATRVLRHTDMQDFTLPQFQLLCLMLHIPLQTVSAQEAMDMIVPRIHFLLQRAETHMTPRLRSLSAGALGDDTDLHCQICFMPVEPNEGAPRLARCRHQHLFHNTCLDTWLSSSQSYFCPFCRTPVERTQLEIEREDAELFRQMRVLQRDERQQRVLDHERARRRVIHEVSGEIARRNLRRQQLAIAEAERRQRDDPARPYFNLAHRLDVLQQQRRTRQREQVNKFMLFAATLAYLIKFVLLPTPP